MVPRSDAGGEGHVRLAIAQARRLVEAALGANGYDDAEAAAVADHLMDCELRGLGYSGLARAVTIIEHDRRAELRRGPIRVVRETAVSALIDGGDDVGYLVANRATDMAIAKCAAAGIAIVGASKTHLTGMYSYYLERVTAAGFVGMIAGSGPSSTAPHGGTEPRFSTNPIAFGFPSAGIPMIWDITTSSVTQAQVLLARRLGKPLEDGIGYDSEGRPTTDPAAVLSGGAMTAWGGHRGSGLAMSIQMLSMMAGQANVHGPWGDAADFGYVIIVVDPGLFGDRDAFRQAISDYAAEIRQSRPLDPGTPVRIPFERSHAERARRLAEGVIKVEPLVVETLRRCAGDA